MFGERLSEIRKDHGHTQSELAALLHVSTPAVRSWEQDKSFPSYDTLIALCRLYTVSSDYLLGLSNEDPAYENKMIQTRLNRDELRLLAEYEAFLIWKRNRK